MKSILKYITEKKNNFIIKGHTKNQDNLELYKIKLGDNFYCFDVKIEKEELACKLIDKVYDDFLNDNTVKHTLYDYDKLRENVKQKAKYSIKEYGYFFIGFPTKRDYPNSAAIMCLLAKDVETKGWTTTKIKDIRYNDFNFYYFAKNNWTEHENIY